MKIIFFFLLLIFFNNNLNAQSNAPKGLISLNYGFIDLFGYEGKHFGPIGIRGERMISNDIAIGLEVSFAKTDYLSEYTTYSYYDSKLVSNSHQKSIEILRFDVMVFLLLVC